MKGTLRFIHKEVKFKEPSGFILRFIHKEVKFKEPSGFMIVLSFNSLNSSNFCPNEKNKISRSKIGSHLSKAKDS